MAARHQDGGRCTVPRADNGANQCSGLYPKHCENRSYCSPTVLGTCLPHCDGTANMNKVCLTAIWVPEEPIHSGPHADPGQGQELRPKGHAGSLGWLGAALMADMPLLALQTSHHPEGARGPPRIRASGTKGHLQQLLLAENGWRHSKSRRLFQAGWLGLLLPVPAVMGPQPFGANPGNGCCS